MPVNFSYGTQQGVHIEIRRQFVYNALPQGTHNTQLYVGMVPVLRQMIYQAPIGVHGVLRHFGISNVGQSTRRVNVWLAGVLVIPSAQIAPGEALGHDISMWVVRPGETIEMQADGGGVFAALHGIEEVA